MIERFLICRLWPNGRSVALHSGRIGAKAMLSALGRLSITTSLAGFVFATSEMIRADFRRCFGPAKVIHWALRDGQSLVVDDSNASLSDAEAGDGGQSCLSLHI